MKTTITLFISMLILFSGCQDIENLTEFDMRYKSKVVVSKSTVLNLPFSLLTPDMETNAESQFAINDTRKDLIEEITLKDLTLTITSPDGQTFRFLKSIEVYLKADSLDEILVASRNSIDNNVGVSISLESTSEDLKEYIKKDAFSLRVKTVTDEALSKDVDIDITSNFFVNAKILGL